MAHPLLDAKHPLNFRATLDAPPLPAGQCLTGPDSIRQWAAIWGIQIHTDGLLFQYTAGIVATATPEDRPYPRFTFDDDGRFLGLALWMPALQAWTIPGQVGQLMTLMRVKATVEEDMAARPLAGWHLCDGLTAGLPNLTTEQTLQTWSTAATPVVNGSVKVPSPWFSGTSPLWDRYTIGYTGT